MQPCILEFEPITLVRHDFARQQPHDDIERLFHHRALIRGLETEHVGIGLQRARPHSQHTAPARHVIELNHALGHHERVVIRKRNDTGSETDLPRALGGDRHEDLGRRDRLVARRVVLTNPRLVEAKSVQPLDELEVAIETTGRILIDRVKRR